ncbi:MAG TPA: response regulator, partial [Gammaproteobacteria bacterium]|nr:response regulator [Gammaproteobacteria bacterium]
MDTRLLHTNIGKSAIARKLILYMVLFGVSVTIVASGIQLYAEYKQEVGAINSRLDQIRTGYIGGIAAAAWTADKEQLNAILRGIVELPDIEYATVRVNGSTFVSNGTEPVSRTIHTTFPLQHLHRSRLITIGEMHISASLEDIYEHILKHSGIVLGTNAIEIFLIAIFFYVLFNKLVTRHLHKMAAFAGRLNINNLDDRLDLEKQQSDAAPDEIDILADTLLRMQTNLGTSVDNLKQRELQLHNAHEELEDKILRRTEALSTAKDEAETANRAKTVFLSSMSHELRTPLNAIMGFAQLLELDADQLNEAQCEAIEYILSGGRHLLELINDVLDLAKIESGHFALSIEDVSVRIIVDDSVQMLRAMAAENDISVEIRHPDTELPMVRADNVRLKQVVLNFLSNAIKYNRKGGRVSVEFEEIPGHFLRVLVSDTGQGIPVSYQRDLFKPFSRLGAEAGEIEGTGIGLTISRELIKLMKGNLGFDTIEGRGSTFWFELPLARVLESRDATASQSNLDCDYPENESGTTLPGARKVMYVEDNSANLELMKNIIAQIPNVQFISAHTAERGITLAEQEKPDLILMDINLPGMDGHKALRKLKQNPATADIPVIAVTANAMAPHLAEAERSAFVSYIIKPFNVADILKS